MKKLFVDILNPERRHYISLFAIVLMMFSLIWSRWLISFGMAILIGNAVLHKDVLHHIKFFFSSKWLMAMSLIFFIYTLSGMYSDVTDEWLRHVRLKLPFLLLPFSFTAMKRISLSELSYLLLIFILLCTISVLPVLWEYFLSYSEINESYLRAQVLPTPISHIRYSILLVLAVVSCVWIWFHSSLMLALKWLSIILGFFLFVFLHLLAVRSGLLALYLALGFITLYFSIVNKKYWVAIAGLSLAFVIPIAAWFTLPTFQNKVKYAKWDVGMFTSDKDGSQYSDSRRLFSWEVALKVFKDSPILGSGIGDLRTGMKDHYLTLKPDIQDEDMMMPHNQWLYVLAGTGLLGLIFFLLAQAFLVFGFGLYKHWLYLTFHIILTSSFIPEATLESQLGVAIYVLFILLLAQYYIPIKINFNSALDLD